MFEGHHNILSQALSVIAFWYFNTNLRIWCSSVQPQCPDYSIYKSEWINDKEKSCNLSSMQEYGFCVFQRRDTWMALCLPPSKTIPWSPFFNSHLQTCCQVYLPPPHHDGWTCTASSSASPRWWQSLLLWQHRPPWVQWLHLCLNPHLLQRTPWKQIKKRDCKCRSYLHEVREKF